MHPQLPRPVGVILLALNHLAIGSFGTLFLPIVLLFAARELWIVIADGVHSKPVGLFLTCLLVIVWLGGYVLYIFIGYGMLKLRSWALKAAVVTHWFGLAAALIALTIAARFDWTLSLSLGAACLLWFGGIIYYLQRPRVRWPFEAATAITRGEPVPSQPPASAVPTWKLVTFVTTACVVCVTVFVVGLFATIERSFRSSTVFAMAIERAQTSPCVAKTFGKPIGAKGFVTGNLSTSTDSGEAELEIPIHGPKTSGNLHLVAKKVGGSWTINSLTAEHSGGQIQLAPVSSPCD